MFLPRDVSRFLAGISMIAGLAFSSPISITFSGSTSQLTSSLSGVVPPVDYDLTFFYDTSEVTRQSIYVETSAIEQATMYLRKGSQVLQSIPLSTSQGSGPLFIESFSNENNPTISFTVRDPIGRFILLAASSSGTSDLSAPTQTILAGTFYQSGDVIKLHTVDSGETYSLPANSMPFRDNATFGKYDSDFHLPQLPSPTAPVPEPASCLIIGTGFAGLGLFARVRQARG